jgi:hypothetical protein
MGQAPLRKPANHGAPVVPRKPPFRTANWRSVVFAQIARLEQDLALVPHTNANAAGEKLVQSAINQAKEFAHAPGTLQTWWGGSLASQSWSSLFLAREELLRLQSEDVVRAQLSYITGLSGVDKGTLAALPEPTADPTTSPAAQPAQTANEHSVSVVVGAAPDQPIVPREVVDQGIKAGSASVVVTSKGIRPIPREALVQALREHAVKMQGAHEAARQLRTESSWRWSASPRC